MWLKRQLRSPEFKSSSTKTKTRLGKSGTQGRWALFFFFLIISGHSPRKWPNVSQKERSQRRGGPSQDKRRAAWGLTRRMGGGLGARRVGDSAVALGRGAAARRGGRAYAACRTSAQHRFARASERHVVQEPPRGAGRSAEEPRPL
jgi:hypothetical protein